MVHPVFECAEGKKCSSLLQSRPSSDSWGDDVYDSSVVEVNIYDEGSLLDSARKILKDFCLLLSEFMAGVVGFFPHDGGSGGKLL